MGDTSETQVLQSNGEFTNKLYRLLAQQQSGNVFFSPISVHAVLSMSYLGAEGSTKEAYVKSLSLSDKDSVADGYQRIATKLNNPPNVTLYWANKIYVSHIAQLKESFSKAVTEKFQSEVESVNFAASAETAGTINKWVKQKTVNKIKDLIDPNQLDSDTRLVLINAIYFKADWNNKFQKSETRTEPFYLNANDKTDVQMMHIVKEFRYKYDAELKCKVLEMPYANQEFSMVIILPDERDGINALEAQLEGIDLTKITDGTSRCKVEVALPKFKIETTIDMNTALDKLGLGEIFSRSADFSGMLQGEEPLQVSKVIQKAFIEVNEEGSEAAAATGMQIRKKRAIHLESFSCDHPFLALLCVTNVEDNSKNILFSAKFASPPQHIHDEL